MRTFEILGYESTSAALAFTLDLLGRDAQVRGRVRDEARRVLADGATTADVLTRLSFTTRVVSEGLRLFPPAHTLVRRASEGGEVLGCQLPRGRIVAVSTWGIHHRRDLWPDPDRFDPDRFCAERTEARDRYSYLPFGGGPRACVAGHLALVELVLAVASVVRAYDLVTPPGDRRVVAGLSLRPSAPLWCRLSPAGG